MKKITFLLFAFCATLFANAADSYVRATSIAVGDKVVLACDLKTVEMTGITTSGTKYGIGTSFTTSPSATFVFDVVAGSSEGTFAFKNNNKYLYWTSGNTLNVDATLSDKTSWTVAIDASGNATISNKATPERVIWWNVTSPRFACYTDKTASTDPASGYGSTQLYKLVVDNTTVSTPTFSVSAGVIYESTSVKIECDTEGATIYYTIDGTEPTTSSTLYAGPINVSSNMTIKAIAKKTGLTNSAVASATYSFPTEVLNIGEFLLQGIADATKTYKITGAVTTIYQNGQSLYIQDATASILVYGTIPQTFENGDQLTGLCGTFTLYKGLPELVPAYVPTKTTGGTPITPVVKTIDEIAVENSNQYIKLEDVIFSAATTFTNAPTNAIVGKKDLSITVRNNFKIEGSYVTENLYTITGFVSNYDGTVQIYPILIEDNGVNKLAQTVLSNKLPIYAVDGSLYVTAEAGSQINVFNVLGQKIASKTAESGETSIMGLKAGQIVIVRTNNKTMKVKL